MALLFANLWSENNDTDEEMLALFADLYISWYDDTGNARYLLLARGVYDKLVSVSRRSNSALLLRMRWAIRANDDAHIDSIVDGVLGADGIKVKEREITSYVELIRYRLLRKEIRYTADVLDVLSEQYPDLIELPYLYSLYYNEISDYQLQKASLQRSIARFEEAVILTKEQKEDLLDSQIRLAEFYLYVENNLIAAREYIISAQVAIEREQNLMNQDLYRVYFLSSNIELLMGNLPLATRYAEKTKKKGYSTVEVEYHNALISYLNKDWGRAGRGFSQLITSKEIDLVNNPQYEEVLYQAMGNSAMMQKNYMVATLYYSKILEKLDREIGQVSIFSVDIDKKVGETALIDRRSQIENNLGVALYYLSLQQFGTSQIQDEALVNLQKANTVFQNLNRNTDFVRRGIVGSPENNIKNILNPDIDEKSLTIYTGISYYLDNEDYWDVVETRESLTEINASGSS